MAAVLRTGRTRRSLRHGGSRPTIRSYAEVPPRFAGVGNARIATAREVLCRAPMSSLLRRGVNSMTPLALAAVLVACGGARTGTGAGRAVVGDGTWTDRTAGTSAEKM